MTYNIRRATCDDLGEIISLFCHGFALAVQPILIDEIQKIIHDPSFVSFVAIDEKKLIGHARIRYMASDKALFGSLVVHETYQNRGVATALSRARLAHLRDNNFLGSALSDAVTLHPYSQQQLYSTGFSPVRVSLGHLPDHGIGPETAIGFAQIFSPTGLWKPKSTELSLYLAPEYRDVAAEVLRPFGTATFQESDIKTPGERTLSFVTEEDALKPQKFYSVRLYEPSASADIAALQHIGYIISSFCPVIHETKISAVAYMYKVADVSLNKEKIKIIPAAQQLFDFVWEQYVK